MAKRHQLVECTPHGLWSVLAEGRRYAQWVVGTQQIIDVDPEWPAVGASLRFRVGVGPLNFEDTCVVRVCEPEHRLELEAHGGLFGTARIAINLVPWGENTLAILDEHPLIGPGAALYGPPGELVLHLRNRHMLTNLARTAHRAA